MEKNRACSAVLIKTRTSYVGAVKPRLVHEKKGAISDILFLKHVYFQLKLVLCVNLLLSVCDMTGIFCNSYQVRAQCTY